ncbi:MAG TPA: TolC family protein [Candidatus Thermoplasmatota archaeon]|nr:TolC family protein [Candidatus Thermoplasmatota archaeon]
MTEDGRVRAAIDRLVKAQRELDAAAQQASKAKARLEAGAATPSDVVIAETRLHRARDWLRMAGQDVKAARQGRSLR